MGKGKSIPFEIHTSESSDLGSHAESLQVAAPRHVCEVGRFYSRLQCLRKGQLTGTGELFAP